VTNIHGAGVKKKRFRERDREGYLLEEFFVLRGAVIVERFSTLMGFERDYSR